MNRILTIFEKFGLLFVLLNCFSLLLPDLAPKITLMEIELEAFGEAQSGGNIKKQLLWLIPLIIYLFCWIREKKVLINKRFSPFILLLSVFLLVLIISILINLNSYSVKRVTLQLIIFSVVFSSVYFSIKRQTIQKCILYLITSTLCICLLTLVLGSGYLSGSLVGWAKTKNVFGAYLLSCILLLQYLKFHFDMSVRHELIFLCILLLGITLTGSKTSLILAILSIPLMRLSLEKTNWFLVCISSLVVLIFIILPGFSYLIGDVWHIAQYMEPESLTGRGLIWTKLYEDLFVTGHIIFGHGYGSYFGVGVIPDAFNESYSFLPFINSAHNGYIEILLQFGFVFSALIICLFIKLIFMTKSKSCSAIAIIILIHNVNESSLMRDQHVMWVSLLVVFFASLCTTSKFIKRERVHS